jgi:dihydrofolate synthase / folylpolyglutamate synthase
MRYREAIEFIIERDGYERGFVANPFSGDDVAALGLARTRGLLERLGNPDHQYSIAHVAGTKGKGSTAAMIASIARAAGHSTGMYATPHLHTFRERILLDGQPVSEEVFAALTRQAAVASDRLSREQPEIGTPTAFEVVTAMALLAFANAGVDLAVVEVGLGGRLDATNVVTPDVSVISSISFDHAAILGNSLASIAAEKGGIIKPGKPVVIGPQTDSVMPVLNGIAAERGAPCYAAGRDWTTEGTRLSGPWGDWDDVDIALAGGHQVENAGIAVMASWLLNREDPLPEQTVRNGLRSVVWPGRFERVASNPETIVDGAHNVDSIRRLAETLRDRLAGRQLAIILGVATDKDLNGILAELAPLAPAIIATASHNPRAVDPEAIAASAARHGLPAQIVPDVGDAISTAQGLTGPNGLVCVTGSLYVVAEAREALGLAETPEFERSLLYR